MSDLVLVLGQRRWDDHHRWGDGWWMWLWGTVVLVVLLVAVAAVVWAILRSTGPTRDGPSRDASARAREILAERYARGEIDTEEYEHRMRTLG